MAVICHCKINPQAYINTQAINLISPENSFWFWVNDGQHSQLQSTNPGGIAMITTSKEIQSLNNQLKEWNVQIAILTAKQNAAAAAAQKFAQQIYELRAKHLSVAQQLRELEIHDNGLYMWENIGDGG